MNFQGLFQAATFLEKGFNFNYFAMTFDNFFRVAVLWST